MKIPLEISYRDVEKVESIEELIRAKAADLEKVCDYITGCRIAVERPHGFVNNGNPFRVRIDITVPPGQEIVVSREALDRKKQVPLPAVIRDTFKTAKRKLKELVEKQRADTKVHPEQEISAIIMEVNHDEGYGFIRDIDGREVYFHKNSIINFDFDQLEKGTGVHFSETEGIKGPQATKVQVIGKPGTGMNDLESEETEENVDQRKAS